MDVKEGDGDSGKRKPRPAVQLYRPGMLKTGTDLTANKPKPEHRFTNSSVAATAKRPPRVPLADNENRQKRYVDNPRDDCQSLRGSSRGKGRGRGRNRRGDDYFDDRSVECNSISSIDEIWSIAGDGTAPQKRTTRRKSSQGSSQSGTYRPMSTSTTSSRKSSLSNFDEAYHYEDVGPSKRYGYNPPRQLHSSSQSLFDRPTTLQESFVVEDREWRRTPRGRGGYVNSGYSRDPEVCSTYSSSSRGDRYGSREESGVFRSNFVRNDRYGSYRENQKTRGQPPRKRGGANNANGEDVDIYGFRKLSNSSRNRENDNHSRPRSRWVRDEQRDSAEGHFERDTSDAVSERDTDKDLCASVDSLDMGSFDWSTEVEAEEQRKREKKEQEEKARLEAERIAKEREQSRASRQPPNWRQRNDFYGGTRGTSSRGRMRHRNDSYASYVSQASSTAESIEERSDGEGESGEKTPTYEDRPRRGYRNDLSGAVRRALNDEPQPQRQMGRGKRYTADRRVDDRFRDRRERQADDRQLQQNPDAMQRNKFSTNREMQNVGVRTVTEINVAPADKRYMAESGALKSNSLPPGMIVVNVSVPPPNLSVPPPMISKPAPPVPPVSLPKPMNVQPPKLPTVQQGSQNRGKVPDSDKNLPASQSSGSERKRPPNSHPTEWPIHTEISRNEGPQIQQLNDTMSVLFERIADSADVAAGEQLLVASDALSQLYMSIMTREIDYTYSMNLEQHLWKQCFYKPIEALRTASNASGEVAVGFRKSLSVLLQQAFAFYTRLLNQYEAVFSFKYLDYIYWQTGLPDDDLLNCTSVGRGARVTTDRTIRLALMSLQRLTVSLGDLYRYNAMVSGVKDYSTARLWYQRSAQLGPGNGRSYNQLALLAVYAIMQRAPLRCARDAAFARVGSFVRANKCQVQSKWVDVVFYYVRALAARYPFETARQPLFTAFNDMRKKINEYEAELNERLGIQHVESELTREDRPCEIWISPDGNVSKRDYDAPPKQNEGIQPFLSESRESLYRRTVAYVLFTAGLLITKIGMERFETISGRALMQLSALLSLEQSPLTSLQLVQLVSVFLFAVHSLTPTNGDPETCTAQQQYAVQTVLSVLGVLLGPVEECLADLERLLTGEVPLNNKVRRVLPAIFVYCEWLSTPSVNKIYNKMPSLEPLESDKFTVRTWHMLATIANALVATEGKLARTVSIGRDRTPSVDVLLPESIFLASFAEAFPAAPKSLHLVDGIVITEQDKPGLLALHARLSSVLSLADFLDGSELHCFRYDMERKCFSVTTSTASESEASHLTDNASLAINGGPGATLSEKNNENGNSNISEEEGLSEEQIRYRRTMKDNQLKQELLERETAADRRIVIEVKPSFVVIDTNCFIYHLESIKRIADSKKFIVLVPSTVIDELKGLQKPVEFKPNVTASQLIDDEHGSWIQQRAELAFSYLTEAKQKGNSQISEVTSKGNKFNLTLASEQEELRAEKTVNDDLILSACVEFSKTLLPKEQKESNRLHRSVVLLTEDRTLVIKAVCANIPSRTIPSFMEWAGLL